MNCACGKFVTVLAALSASCLRAQHGPEVPLARANLASVLGPTFAVADFDHDDRPDGAVLLRAGVTRGTGFRVELHLSTLPNSEVAFNSNESLHGIAAFDIDNDSDADIIVEHPLTHRRLYAWLNDGYGRFTESRVAENPGEARTSPLRFTVLVRKLHPRAPFLRSPRPEDGAITIARRLIANSLHAHGFADLDLSARPASADSSESRSRAPPCSSPSLKIEPPGT